MAQAHVNAVAGACLAVGIRYAGSGNAQAKATLLELVTTYLSYKMRAPDPFAGQDLLKAFQAPCLNRKSQQPALYRWSSAGPRL